MVDPIDKEKRRREAAVREHKAHERDPAALGEERPYDPDTGAVGTTKPRGVQAMGSAGPTGVVPPRSGSQWKRPAVIVGVVLLLIVLLLLLS